MRLYFARHGESEGNVKLLLYGRTDCPLTENGRADGRALREKLRDVDIKRCYASPLSRAAETARLALEGRDVPIEYTDALMEQDMGDYENTVFMDVRQREPELVRAMLFDWGNCVIPGGESYGDVRARVDPLLDEVIARGEDTLFVAHNGPLCAILARLLDATPTAMDKFLFRHGCYSSVEIKDGRVRLEYFNR